MQPGGYHPAFEPPAHFPVVLAWDSLELADHLTIKGDAYYVDSMT